MTTGNLRKSRGLFVHFTPDGRRKKRGCLLCKNVDWFKFHAGTKHRFPWYSREVSLQPDFTKETGTSQKTVTRYCYRKVSPVSCRHATRTDVT